MSEKQRKDLWNNDNSEGCFSSIISSIMGMGGILIVVGLAAFALGFLEKAIQAVFPILVIAALIGVIFNALKK
tara:strand:- start:4 stop:222 length:219 start_codon:yes stop_codon:yes gene_type:complete